MFYTVLLYVRKEPSMTRMKYKEITKCTATSWPCFFALLLAWFQAVLGFAFPVSSPSISGVIRATPIGGLLGGGEESGLHVPFYQKREPGENFEMEYDIHHDTVIPGWATGITRKHNGRNVVCFDGTCKGRGFMPDDEGPERRSRVFVPPPPSGWNTPESPIGKRKNKYGLFGKLGGEDDDTPIPVGPPVNMSEPSGFENVESRDQALNVLFSIGDDDTYLLLTQVALDLPLKTFVSSVSMTTSEMKEQDKKGFLMEELEGKGTSVRYDTGLNVLYSSGMFFYLPKTALSLIIAEGRLVYSSMILNMLKYIGFNVRPFNPGRDGDGSSIYYIPIYNATIALPNPQVPIVSQVLATIDGLALSVLKVKRLEIVKGIAVLSSAAYSEEDIAKATESIKKFTDGGLTNPITDMAFRYDFGEYDSEEDEYTENDESESSSSSSSSESESSISTESVSSSDSSEYEEYSSSTEAFKQSKNTLKMKKKSAVLDSLLASTSKWRERAESSKEADYRDYASKKASKYEKKAKSLQEELFSSSQMADVSKTSLASTSAFAAASSLTASAASSISNAASALSSSLSNAASSVSNTMSQVSDAASSIVGSTSAISSNAMSNGSFITSGLKRSSTSLSSSLVSSSIKKNTSLKQVVDSSKTASSSVDTSSLSVYESSLTKAISNSFSDNAASLILNSHQSQEAYYQDVSSAEYATRELKHVVLGIAMQHSVFSSNGSIYQSQAYVKDDVTSVGSSSNWVSARIAEIVAERRWLSTAMQKYAPTSTTSTNVARATAKEQAMAAAAIHFYKKAAKARKEMAYVTAMRKRATSQGNSRLSKGYHRRILAAKKAYAKHIGRAAWFGKATAWYVKIKNRECAKQAAIFAERMKNPESVVTKKDMMLLQKTVAQILTSSQIQMLGKILSPIQIRVLTKMFTPAQIQQTLVHLGVMTPEQIQFLLYRLQLKGLELQKGSGVQMPSRALLQSAGQPLNVRGSKLIAKFTGPNGNQPRMSAIDMQRFLSQGQLLFEIREDMFTPGQIEELRRMSTQQTRMYELLIKEINASKARIEESVKQRMLDTKMKFSISACNPLLSLQVGRYKGAFDGLTSAAALKFAGDLSLKSSEQNAIRQILSSPSVANYVGVDPTLLSSCVYEKMSLNDLMCLMAKNVHAGNKIYKDIQGNERQLIGQRYNSAKSKLFSLLGNSAQRLEQALMAAFNLVKNSSIKCSKHKSQLNVPSCQMLPFTASS